MHTTKSDLIERFGVESLTLNVNGSKDHNNWAHHPLKAIVSIGAVRALYDTTGISHRPSGETIIWGLLIDSTFANCFISYLATFYSYFQ